MKEEVRRRIKSSALVLSRCIWELSGAIHKGKYDWKAVGLRGIPVIIRDALLHQNGGQPLTAELSFVNANTLMTDGKIVIVLKLTHKSNYGEGREYTLTLHGLTPDDDLRDVLHEGDVVGNPLGLTIEDDEVLRYLENAIRAGAEAGITACENYMLLHV